ncbi:MAG: oxidoreductase [Proteobacteria bacterium]|nr:oxidoreductase [Pseudomonadota bacterium]
MESFRAYRVHDEDGMVGGRLDTIGLDDLSPGEVVIRAAYSDVNYKDALAATGKGKIMRRYPMVGGIDVAGRVHSSTDDRFRAGDAVAVIGCGLSESHDGGYAEYVRVSADFPVVLPDGVSLYQSMALGTAGFTAAMAIDRMERNGQKSDSGPILVNGATGGVGSFAIDMLSGLGYQVVALTGKRSAAEYLKHLGAADVVYRDELQMGQRALEKGRWAGAIDSLGGETLAWLTRTMTSNGNIASIGLAQGAELKTTVMPFILRGINLLGINSVVVSHDFKERIWRRLASDLMPRHLDHIVTRKVTLDELAPIFDGYLRGEVQGRTVVQIASE